jgi:hypothetical protein
MKTKWGSCNVNARRVWFNLELAKKPIRCLEYIAVHELVLKQAKREASFSGSPKLLCKRTAIGPALTAVV